LNRAAKSSAVFFFMRDASVAADARVVTDAFVRPASEARRKPTPFDIPDCK